MVTRKERWDTLMKWTLVFIAVLGLIIPAGRSAFGQDNAGPCAEDVARFCKDVQPGAGGIAKCLKEHKSELSTSCKEMISRIRERRMEFRQACRDDALKFCKDVQPGGGRVIRCLKEHENDLSAACRSVMAQGKRQQQ